jgi:hypothetical protein
MKCINHNRNMASRAFLRGAEIVGKKLGQEAFALGKEVTKEFATELGPQYIEEQLKKHYGNTTSDEYKEAKKFAMQAFKLLGAAKSARRGALEHMHGLYRKNIAKNMASQFLYPHKPNAEKNQSLHPHKPNAEKKVGVLASILKQNPYEHPSIPALKAIQVKSKDCSVLQDLNFGEFYVCKKGDSRIRECTHIHSTAAGELETIMESHKECLTDELPLHNRKCGQRSVHDLSNGYSIYNCSDELQTRLVHPPMILKKSPPKEMIGGRRRYTRKGGRGYRRRKGTRKH